MATFVLLHRTYYMFLKSFLSKTHSQLAQKVHFHVQNSNDKQCVYNNLQLFAILTTNDIYCTSLRNSSGPGMLRIDRLRAFLILYMGGGE